MRRCVIALVTMLALLPGCAAFRPRPAEIQVRLVNDGNRLLTVEGTSDLPEGAAIEATLREGPKRILARGRSLLSGSRFFLTLDLSGAPGNHPLSLEVFFDPVSAPAPVLAEVGEGGGRLVGEQVEWEHGRRRVVERLQVVLPMEPREAALRKVARGDHAAGIAALEQVVERNPDDVEASAWLAIALLERSPSERRPGSRAHRLLEEASKAGFPASVAARGRDWLDRLAQREALARIREEREEARREAAARRERMASSIVPGRSLGLIELGMAAGKVFALYSPDHYPAWGGEGVERVTFPRREGLTVDFDRATARVVRVLSTSDKLRLEDDLGVGSPFLAVREKYPRAAATFGEDSRTEDGTRVARGVCVVDGLEFVVRRTFDPMGPPLDEVEAIGVVPAAGPSEETPPSLTPGMVVIPAAEQSPPSPQPSREPDPDPLSPR